MPSQSRRDVAHFRCDECGQLVRKDRCLVDGRDRLHNECWDKRYGAVTAEFCDHYIEIKVMTPEEWFKVGGGYSLEGLDG